MVRQKLNNNGFTFIELVITVAILAIIMVSISTFMASTTAVYTRTTKDNEVQIEAQEVYNTINTSIMQANVVKLLAKSSGGGSLWYATDEQTGVTGYKESTGVLVNKTGSTVSFSEHFVTSAGSKSHRTGYYRAFKTLKEADSTDPTKVIYEDILVDALYIEYQTKKSDGTYTTAYVTYVVDPSTGKLYMNRHLEGETNAGIIDKSISAENLLSDKLLYTSGTDYGFKVNVDADANSIGVILDFKNATMTYKTLGMTKIRNSNVLTRK